MKRVLYLAILSLVASTMFAPAALGQSRGPSGADGTFNCEDFDTQEQAQQFFLSDPGDTNGLDADNDGMACDNLPSGGGTGTATPPATPTQSQPPATPTTSDLDCADFASQAEAQATFNADPSDPNGLDADGDGIACEENTPTTPTATQYTPPTTTGTTPTTGTTQYQAPVPGSAECPETRVTPDGIQCSDLPDVTPPSTTTAPTTTTATTAPTMAAPTMAELPATGGISLMLPAAVLLLGSGLIGLGVLRRK